MNKREELIAKYAKDLEEKCGVKPNLDLLTKITIGCGPSIYLNDASTLSATDPKEVETVKKNFLIKKLGLKDSPELDKAIIKVANQYGKSNPKKYRAVVYYLLTLEFKKQAIYK